MSKIEKNYLRQIFVSNKRMWLVVGIVMFMILPFSTTLLANVARSLFGLSDNYMNALPSIQPFIVFALATIALAFGLALYQFRFLMNSQHCSLMFSTPIKRSHLFRIHYLSGLFLLFCFTSISYILMLLPTPDVMHNVGVYASIFICGELLGFVCYSLFTLLTMLTNRFSDAIVLCCVYIILPLLLVICMQKFFFGQLNLIFVASGFDWQEFLSINNLTSPITPFISFFDISLQQFVLTSNFQEWNSTSYTANSLSFWFCVYWIMLAGLSYVTAHHLFTKRKAEEAGQRTTSFFAYPLLIFVLTILLVLFNTDVTWGSTINLIFVFLFYFGLTCFAFRRIKLTRSMTLRFLSILVLVGGFTYLFQTTKAFHLIEEIPEEADVAKYSINLESADTTCINGNSPLYPDITQLCDNHFYVRDEGDEGELTDADDIHEIIELQKRLVEKASRSDTRYHDIVYINYIMKDNTSKSRYYYINDIETQNVIREVFSQYMNKGYLDQTIYDNITEQ